MLKKSFRGGVHPDAAKLTADRAIEIAPLPAKVVIPLQQHIGAPCQCLVNTGDVVRTGQKIGEAGGHVSAPVHASISGKVVAVQPMLNPQGQEVLSIIIESDGQDTPDPGLQSHADWESLSQAELVGLIRESGMVGLGGAAFPTHVKYAPPKEKTIDTVILNGAECEPYLTCDHRVMLERADRVIMGLRAFMKAVHAPRGFVAVEDNKPDAIQALILAAKPYGDIQIAVLKTKYPQGEERMIIKVLMGREVPLRGLPSDVGVVVTNVATAASFAEFLATGRPLVDRVVTITGPGVHNPKNLQVRIGTSLADAVKLAGGLKDEASKLIVGGPMTGPAFYTLDVPVLKGTAGLLAFTDKEVRLQTPIPCVGCGRCIEACPYGLMPNLIGSYAEKRLYSEAERFGLMDCRECGCCSFICPSRRPLLQAIKTAKFELAAKRKRA